MKLRLTVAAAILAAALSLGADYPDGRPVAALRLEAKDQGVVLRHGDGPGGCDTLGARDIWIYESGGTYYMHYDGAGARGWLACLATSADLVHWAKKGPVLDFGKPAEQIENTSLYFEPANRTWFLFTNHIGLEGFEYTDAVWLELPLEPPAAARSMRS